jgi:site-specific DNA-methyltransferase (adenine-specific)
LYNKCELYEKHPTQKPFALVEFLLKCYATQDSVVLDNCMGSNTTGDCCKKLKMPYLGIEKEKKWFKVSCQRVSLNLVHQ